MNYGNGFFYLSEIGDFRLAQNGYFHPALTVSLNAGNIIDEEMMTILFYANEGVITKIKIQSGN